MMKVKLLAHTPEPIEVCAKAARVSHSAKPAEEITVEDPAGFLQRLIKIGHESVVEHASFTFSISGISRVCSHQLVRHRLASYTQRSQRYVRQEASFVVPADDEEIRAFYKKAHNLYQRLLEKGLRKEDARYVLPQGITTSIVVTMNARELRHFFKLRLDIHAQWEIRALALRMFELAYGVAPGLFEDLKPLAERARASLVDQHFEVMSSGKMEF